MAIDCSVVIPAYNGSRYLRDALESVFAQSRLPCEVLVVDDCSPDDTIQVAVRAASNAPTPVRVIRLPKNSGGPARPINVGVREARGSLIAVLDQDDVYERDMLELAADALAEAPDCHFACHWAGAFAEPRPVATVGQQVQQDVMAAGERCGHFLRIPGNRLLNIMLESGNFLCGFPGFVFRRDAFLEKGGVDESLRICGDLDVMGWFFQHGNVALVPVVGYRRRVHDANATGNASLMYLEMARVLGGLAVGAPGIPTETAARVARRLEGFAYWLREGHCYSEAAEVNRILARLGRGRGRSALEMMKLRVHQAAATIFRRQPVVTPFSRRSGQAAPTVAGDVGTSTTCVA